MNNPDLLKMARWCRWMLAFVFIYHGLVPKLLFPSPVEVQMIEASGLLAGVALVAPALLVGAFNPVTTTLPALLLCVLIIRLEAGCNTAA